MKELLIWEEEGELKYLEFSAPHALEDYLENWSRDPNQLIWNYCIDTGDWFSNLIKKNTEPRPIDDECLFFWTHEHVPANIQAFALLLT